MPTDTSDSTKTITVTWSCLTRDLFAWLRAIKRAILLLNRNYRLIITNGTMI